MESILTSIKKMLGIDEEYECFDVDIIIHINSVLMILTQLGVGPPEGFRIVGKTTTWDELVPNSKYLDAIKSYIYLKVKLLFDPPLSSAVIESTNRQINELEWRLYVAAETIEEEENQNGE